ncbi:MAG: UDP-N-acetylglucosamine 2-epimerase (non-hydrolyzing) [Chitinivibrionales bacterium]|nr:UDP-N-acetylglucosamine 2-epimerase (non-hydrolyzing) [Chitinivibrionales bacterium]
MKTILTIIGARPQFIKAAPVSKALRKHGGFNEVVVHTGQHYDNNMSAVFFDELEMKEPDHNLEVGSASHAVQTAEIMKRLEPLMVDQNPETVLIYGDTNSTLAAALVAAKLHYPVAHVEAGLRSFNMRMPEEINRIVADRVSSILFCPTSAAVKNLQNEGLTQGVHNVGDVMYDAALMFREKAEQKSEILDRLCLRESSHREHRGQRGEIGRAERANTRYSDRASASCVGNCVPYALATIHRAENTDDPVRLKSICTALVEIAGHTPVILPMHPRTRKALGLIEEGSASAAGKASGRQRYYSSVLSMSLWPIAIIEPCSFLDMVALEANAKLILTDSGGMQKEAYFHRVPCVTLRDETEWVETVASGWNLCCNTRTPEHILSAARESDATDDSKMDISDYGNGEASSRVAAILSRSQ